MTKAAARARKCFSLAARAGTPGERDAALARGMAIVERNELNPNDFDIPGRLRGKRGHVIIDDPLGPSAEDRFTQQQRDQRWQARVNAHELGRARFTVLTNDFS